MKYSAGMMSVPYLFLETRKTAELLLIHNDINKIKSVILNENIYQMKSMYRAERYFNAINRRLNGLPESLTKIIACGSIPEAKELVLISIMFSDTLFFEFMYEVFRTELMIGSKELSDKVINQFFAEKAAQIEAVAKWKDTTIAHLKQYYVRILFESGYLSDIKKPRLIQKVWINDTIRNELNKAGMGIYLYALTGEQ